MLQIVTYNAELLSALRLFLLESAARTGQTDRQMDGQDRNAAYQDK